MLARKI